MGALLHLVERLSVQVTGVRIEAGQHTVDRILDQVSVGDRIDVIEAHPLQHIAKQSEQSIGIGPVTVLGECRVDDEREAKMPCDQVGRGADCYTGQEGCGDPASLIVHGNDH